MVLLGVAQATWATEYVSEVILIGSGTSASKVKQQYVDQGWKDTNYNLNKGCGSDATNIYLLYKTSTNKADAITGFYIQCGSSSRSETQNINGHTYNPVEGVHDNNFIKGGCNLNNNAGGNKIYLFYTKEAFDGREPITDIWFDNAPTGAVGSNGDDNSGCDLNAGAGGSFIYMHAYYGERPNSFKYEEREWNATSKKVVTTTKTCDSFTRLTSNNNKDKHTVLTDGWYVLDYDIEYYEYLDIDGDVKIILMDGKTMNAKDGIRIKTDKKLTIYGQSGNSGKIKADGSIGGKGDIYAGEFIVHGGTIDCKGKSNNNAAIGSGNGANNSKTNFKAITIYGGNITANGRGGGAGIGSGQECKPHGPITIYGGTINAKGGDGGAGIGGGEESGNGPIYIYGGTVTAESGGGAGIGCGEDSHLTNDIHILGGTVKVDGKGETAIGVPAGGETPKYDFYIQDATVSIKTVSTYSVWVRDFHVSNSTVKFANENHACVRVSGSIDLADNLCVEYKSQPQTNVSKDDRENYLKGRKEAKIQVCSHSGATYKDNGDGTHSVSCKWCFFTKEGHRYKSNNGIYTCSKCGVSKEFTAQVLWSDGNKTLNFLNTQEDYQVGKSYHGQTITSVWKGDQVTNTGTNAPAWSTVKAEATNVIFDASFADVTPQSLYQWFEGFTSLTTLNVNNMNVSEVTNAQGMFQNCENLKTIFCDNTWSSIANSTDMFTGCTSLKGSMGTVNYSPDNTNDITFANPSTGYFSNTGAVFAQALWCDGNKTLYFTCPKAPLKVGETYNGQTITSVWSGGHVLLTGDSAPGWSTLKDEATNVVFDASFFQATPQSLNQWFEGFTGLTTVRLTFLDVSEVESAVSMFSGCTNLTTLYCANAWTIANTEGMFTGCTSLKGAVNYDELYENGTMANPTTGYFMKSWTVELLNDGITVSNRIPFTNETVTISGTGDSGKGIVSLIVTGQRTGTDITVIDNGDGTRSFTMPAEDVTIREKIDIAIYDGKDNSEVLKQYKGKTVNITYDRILKATDNGDGTWTSKAYTVCLPYEKDLQDEFWADQVRLYELAIVNENYEFVFNGVPSSIIKAGKPYLVVVDQETINLSAEGVMTQALPDQDEDEGVVYPSVEAWQNQDNVCGWWRGTYRLIDNEECTQLKAFLLNSDGKWRGTNNDTEAHRKAYLPTFRAYYVPKEFTDYRNYDTKFTVLGAGGDPAETWYRLPGGYAGEVDYNGETGIRPVIHTIDADGTNTYYDLQGRRISNGQKPTTKGIYINNGKKIR